MLSIGSNVIRVIHRDPGAGNTRSCSPPPESPRSSMSDPCDPSSGCSNAECTPQNKIAPQRRWIFTWNNYPDNWEAYFSIHRHPHGKLHGYMGEKEVAPTTGTPHIQGWIDFGEGCKGRPFTLQLPKQVSFRKMKGSPQANFSYCSKEDQSYVCWGTCVKAEPFKIQIDFDRSPWMHDCFALLQTDPHSREVWWIWEPVGKSGKTIFCKWYQSIYGDCLVLEGKASDMKNGIIKYRKKHDCVPRVVLCNVPRSKDSKHISWCGIEQVKDMLFYSGKYEGGMVNDKHPHVLFFANWEPDVEELSGNRWQIVRIPDGPGEGKPRYLRWGFKDEPTIEQCLRLGKPNPGFVFPDL